MSEIKYSEIIKKNPDLRMDSEYFKKEYIKFFDSIVNNLVLDTVVDVKGGKRLPLGEDFSQTGTPYIRAEDVKNTFVDYRNSPKISYRVYQQIKQYQTKMDDVLLTIVGNSIGDTGFVSFNLNICNLTENCVRLVSKKINPKCLFAYFLSKYGQMQIEREKVGTAQPKLAIERIRRFRIPNFSPDFQSQIEQIVKSAQEKLSESKSLYAEAEEILLLELGLKNWQPGVNRDVGSKNHHAELVSAFNKNSPKYVWDNVNYSVKSFSDFVKSGRLDSEYYQPKYDELFEHLAKYKCTKLGDIVAIKKSIEPGSDSYIEEGIPFIRVSDVNKFEIKKTDLHLSPKEFSIEVLRPHKDTILFSKDGTIGIAYKCEKDLDIITSGALLHLDVRNENILPDYLTLVLNSIVTQLQAERDSNGAIIQHWKTDDIKKIIVPVLPMQTQSLIAEKIQKSFALRKQSKRLLEQAKRMVEEEIEKKENR